GSIIVWGNRYCCEGVWIHADEEYHEFQRFGIQNGDLRLVRNGDLRVHGSCSTKCLNGMIAGLVREGRFEEGLGLFVEMIGEGFSPDGFSLGSLVSGWAGLEGLGIGRQVHSYDGDRFGFKIELDEIRFNSVVFILICGCCCCCCFVEVEVVVALVEIDHVFESRIVLL
ncbi:hypothetical protein Drorol1_Dr00009125, partial [Drosera rotundifolia]